MTKQQAVVEFKDHVLPLVQQQYEQDGQRDRPARREAWNNFTDALCKDRRITERQYMTWIGPSCSR